MLFRSTAHTFQASMTALARQGLFFIPLVLTLPLILGLLGIQIAQPVSDAFTLCLAFFMQRQVMRDMDRLENENHFSAG